jgi:ABC-2 type transport system ATP-binding protein
MAMVDAVNLVKVFDRPDRLEGRSSAVRTLFTRHKKRTLAVDGMSLSIDEREIVGYLGPNCAGKSTTIKMLTGNLVPTSGTATVSGIVPWRYRTANARSGWRGCRRSPVFWPSHLPPGCSCARRGPTSLRDREVDHNFVERDVQNRGVCVPLGT